MSLRSQNRSQNRAQWHPLFSGLVERSLRTSQALLRENADSPAALRPHLESILSQVEWGYHLDPALSAQLLLELDPWPARWGMLDLWAAQLKQALRKLPARHPLRPRLSAGLAQVYSQLGLFGPVCQIASKILEDKDLPPAEFVVLVTRCGGAWISALVRLGLADHAKAVSDRLMQRLENSAPHTPLTPLVSARAVLALQDALIARHQGQLPAAIEIMDGAIQALESCPDFDKFFLRDLLENRAVFYYANSRFQAALDDLETIQTKYLTSDDELMRSSLHGNRGLVYWGMQRYSDAEVEMRLAVALTEKNKATYLLMKQVAVLGIICMARGDLTSALSYIERQLDLANLINDEPEKLMGSGNRAVTLAYAGNPAPALPVLLENLRIFEQQGRSIMIVSACLDLVPCHYSLEQMEAGAAIAQKALDLVNANDFAWLRAVSMRGLALYLPSAAAIDLLRQALSMARETGRRLDEAGCLLWLAHLTRDLSLWQAGLQLLAELGAEKWIQNQPPYAPILLPFML